MTTPRKIGTYVERGIEYTVYTNPSNGGCFSVASYYSPNDLHRRIGFAENELQARRWLSENGGTVTPC